jgi:CelD/BcsL family acetyltransferase involved in cellulose biosynthesis
MGMLRVNVLTGAGLFQELSGPWQDLVENSPEATPFQTFEWHETWWRHFGGFREPLAICVYEGDDLVGLMPLTRTYAPWRTIRPMGVGPADYLHPVARAGYGVPVAEQVFHTLQESKKVDLIDLHQVRETQSLASVFEGTKLMQATCLVLDLPSTYDAYLATLGKSLRYDVRKLDKSLFNTGRAVIEQISPNKIDEGMDILFEQHKKRWRKRGLPGAFFGRGTRFHREWAPKAARNGWLWLSVLRVDGEPIGAIYAMRLGETAFYYQAGFDPSKGAVSPGTLLVAHTIRRAIDEGAKHFDFMRGDEPYKRRWKPQHSYNNLRLLAPTTGLLGNLGSSWNRFGCSVEARIRARLEGRGLI